MLHFDISVLYPLLLMCTLYLSSVTLWYCLVPYLLVVQTNVSLDMLTWGLKRDGWPNKLLSSVKTAVYVRILMPNAYFLPVRSSLKFSNMDAPITEIFGVKLRFSVNGENNENGGLRKRCCNNVHKILGSYCFNRWCGMWHNWKRMTIKIAFQIRTRWNSECKK